MAKAVKTGEEKMTIKDGDRVSVHYEGTFEDGTIFDSTFKTGAPKEFVVGAPNILPGFSEAVRNMEVGVERTISVKPTLGYGEVNPELIFEMDLKDLPVEGSPVVGSQIQIQLKEGLGVTGRITSIDGDRITVDLNHPLCGKTLIYRIELLEADTKDIEPSE